MTRRRSLVVVAVAAVGTIALAAGIAQGSDGSVGPTQVATISAGVELAEVRPCPGADPVGELDPGATISLTGRSEDGAWLRLESPIDDDGAVWIDATLVVVTTPEELPIARCGDVDVAIELLGGGELVLTPKTTTTTTTPASGDPEVAAGGATTSTAPGDGDDGDGGDDDDGGPGGPPTTGRPPGPTGPAPTSPPTTAPRTTTTARPTTTTTTAPPDVTPPTVDTFTKNRARIQEQGCSGPVRVLLTARAQDASGVARARVIWRIQDAVTGTTLVNGSTGMADAGGGVWQVNLGPYDQSTVSGNGGVLIWRVLATDASPNANEALVDPGTDLRLPVQDCP